MAYNADNEVREELAKIQKNQRGEFIIASRIQNKNTGNVNVDIRQFYTGDEDDLKPTSKGVRFNIEMLPDMVEGLASALEENEILDLIDKLNEVAKEKGLTE